MNQFFFTEDVDSFDPNDPLWNENGDEDWSDDEDDEELVKEKTRSHHDYFNAINASIRFGLSTYATAVMICAILLDLGITDKTKFPSEFRIRTMRRKYGKLLKERYIVY